MTISFNHESDMKNRLGKYAMTRHLYECPVSEDIDLEPLLDVCINLSPRGNTESFSTSTSSSGWEDEFSD